MRKFSTSLAALMFLSAMSAGVAYAQQGPSRDWQAAREAWRANHVVIDQRGPRNAAAAFQRGAANFGAVAQNGARNFGAVTQNGDNNAALVRQVGDNNTGAVTQNNSGNSACLIQLGSGLSNEIVQNGGESAGIIQTSRGVRSIPAALCTVDAPVRAYLMGR